MGFFSCNYLTTINFLHKSRSPHPTPSPSHPRLENKKLRDGRKDIHRSGFGQEYRVNYVYYAFLFIAPPGAKRLLSVALETYFSLDPFCPFIVHLATCYD